MFRVETFVDDKKLAQLLHALAGIAIGTPNIQPVANATAKGGKINATSDELCDLFKAYAKKHKLDKVKPADVRAFCKANGRAETSYGYVIKRLFECKMLKKHGTGTGMYYTVVTA